MEKVIEVKEIKEQDKELGPYTRRKCLVRILDGQEERVDTYYLDSEEVIEKIYAYIDYLKSSKDNNVVKKRSLTSDERRNRNMKATKFYAIGLVLMLMSPFGPETAGIPLLLGGALVTLVTALIANDLLFYRRIENDKDTLDFQSKIYDAEELIKEVQLEMSRKKNMDYARYKILENAKKRKQEMIDRTTLRNAIYDLRNRAIREVFERRKNQDIPLMESANNYHEFPDVIVQRR